MRYEQYIIDLLQSQTDNYYCHICQYITLTKLHKQNMRYRKENDVVHKLNLVPNSCSQNEIITFDKSNYPNT